MLDILLSYVTSARIDSFMGFESLLKINGFVSRNSKDARLELFCLSVICSCFERHLYGGTVSWSVI